MGRSQRWFAEQAHISSGSCNVWLSGRPCSAKWIKGHAVRFAEVLGCTESEILERIPVSAQRPPRVPEKQPLNKNILRALAETEDPTDKLLSMLQRVQREIGAELSYEICVELIKFAKASAGQ